MLLAPDKNFLLAFSIHVEILNIFFYLRMLLDKRPDSSTDRTAAS